MLGHIMQYYYLLFVIILESGMNIFRYWEMLQETENARIYERISDKLLIIEHDLLHRMNNGNDWWHKNNLSDIREWLSFGNKVIPVLIPRSLVDHCRLSEPNCGECVCVVEFKDELIGMIMVKWGSGNFIYSFKCGNDSAERCVNAQILARGLLSSNVKLSNVDVPDIQGVRYIPLIDRKYIMKNDNGNENGNGNGMENENGNETDENVRRNPGKDELSNVVIKDGNDNDRCVYYQSDLLHQIGFVKHEATHKFTCDFKEIFNVIGGAGATTKFPCPWCYVTKISIRQNPTIDNTCFGPRHPADVIQAATHAVRNENIPDSNQQNCFSNESKGIKFPPICKIYPNNIGSPNVHVFGGRCGRYVFGLKKLFLQIERSDEKLLEEYDALQNKIYLLEREIEMHQNLIDMIKLENISNGNGRDENGRNGNENDNSVSTNWNDNESDCSYTELSGRVGSISRNGNGVWDIDTSDILDTSDDESRNDCNNVEVGGSGRESSNGIIDLKIVEDRLEEYIDKHQKLIDDQQQLECKMGSTDDRRQLWNEYKLLSGVEELEYRKDDITGPSALKFVNKGQVLIDSLQKINPRAAQICEFLLPLLKFLVHSACHKNTIALSDDFIELHKFAVLHEDYVGRLLLKLCNEKDEDSDIAVGFKGHTIYHEHLRMAHSRMTPAHSDDQRPELVCKMCKNNIRKFRNSLNRKTVRTLVRAMNSEHGLYFDKTCLRSV